MTVSRVLGCTATVTGFSGGGVSATSESYGALRETSCTGRSWRVSIMACHISRSSAGFAVGRTASAHARYTSSVLTPSVVWYRRSATSRPRAPAPAIADEDSLPCTPLESRVAHSTLMISPSGISKVSLLAPESSVRPLNSGNNLCRLVLRASGRSGKTPPPLLCVPPRYNLPAPRELPMQICGTCWGRVCSSASIIMSHDSTSCGGLRD